MIRVSWGEPGTIEHPEICTVELDRRIYAARNAGHQPPPADTYIMPPISVVANLRQILLKIIGWKK